MPGAKFDRLEPEKKDRILDAAARELAEHGYDGSSLNRMLAAAGISKSTAYYYFDDKADLCFTVIERYWQALMQRAEFSVDALTTDNFWNEVGKLFKAQFSALNEKPWLWGTLKAMRSMQAEVRDNPRFEEVRRFLTALFEKALSLGVIRQDLPPSLVIALLHGVDSAGDQWLEQNAGSLPPAELSRIVDSLQQIIRNVVSPPSTSTLRSPS